MKNIVKQLVYSCIMILPSVLLAQDRQEIQPSLNQIKIFESLFVSQMHSSLLDKQEFKVYNDLNFLFDSQKGDFYRKQQGSQTTLYGVSSQGTKKWDKIYLKGNFNYNRIKQENVKFNASILDPFRGMPFIVADTNSSRWNKQQIDFNAQGILKVSNKMSLGLFTGFEVYSGAKQRDIRSENYRYKLQINPSLSYHLTNNSSISAELNYVSFKEESSNSNTNTYIDQPYYELYGLGHHVKAIGSGRTTNYFGNTLGTGINYLYKQKGYWLLFYGKTDLQVEDVEISFSIPKKDGTVKSRENKLGVFWGNTMDRYQSKVQLEYGNTNRKAIEYISLYDSNIDNLGWDVKGQFVFSSYKMDRIDLGVDYLTKESTTGDFINWFTIKLSYLNQKDKYLATGSKFYNSSGVGEFKYQRNLSVLRKKGELIASMGLKYKHSFSSDYKYNGGYPNSLVVTELMQNELQYIDSSYWRIAPEIIYSLKLDKNTSSIFYLKASYNYLNTNNKKLNTYSGLQFNVGFTF
ncbi:DUF6850 family outer membrane beta-barrel protein [Myroides odoratimimus]|uniref:DUF6850 family outer membrane beta-barrel protein n=1 Tax=Myroides odoratimimus TaxID=76832 RepID=UPI00370C7DD8